jgi:hypothetical protein
MAMRLGRLQRPPFFAATLYVRGAGSGWELKTARYLWMPSRCRVVG